MKVPHRKGVASHPDPESCASVREGEGEALTGENAGQVLSCEIKWSGVPTPLMEAEGQAGTGATREPVSDPAQ